MYTCTCCIIIHVCLPGIDSAVMEERRRGRHELSEAQSLLEVARREQAKTALQLQLAEKKVHTCTCISVCLV